jgi:hypothetical protein
MGASKLRTAKGPTDYFLATLFAPEIQLPVTPEIVVIHEVGHAIANTVLDYPVEFMSITWRLDGIIGGFTKNTQEAKLAIQAEMRRNNRSRALQLAAIQFAGPLSEYKHCITRYLDTKSISYFSRGDKIEAFRTFNYANGINSVTSLRHDTGDVDFSPEVLRGREAAWAQWKIDAYALAKSVLDSPAARVAAESISADVLRRLGQGVEVKILGSDIRATLTTASQT